MVTSNTFTITQLDDTNFETNFIVLNHEPSLLLFLNYNKGTEDKIVLEFLIKENALNTDSYYLSSLSIENVAIHRQVFLTQSDKIVVPVNIPLNADALQVKVKFHGSDTSAIGSLVIDHRVISSIS